MENINVPNMPDDLVDTIEILKIIIIEATNKSIPKSFGIIFKK